MKNILSEIIDYLAPYKNKILFVVICIVAFCIVMILPPSPIRSVLSLIIVFVFVVEGYKWIGQPELWGTKIGKSLFGKFSKNDGEDEANVENVTIIKLFTDEEEEIILDAIEQDPELLNELDTIKYKATVNYDDDIESQIIPEGTNQYKYEYHIIHDGNDFYHVASYEMSDNYEEY
ncbi:TPA: hypothetical protein ACF9K4_002743 [Staphylococcus aureus]|nr:hypothetical protein [Staphylococcus aureus]